jgi:hypothetical protein
MVWNRTFGWVAPDDLAQRQAAIEHWRAEARKPGIIQQQIEQDRAERERRLEQARRAQPPETLGVQPEEQAEKDEGGEFKWSAGGARSRDLKSGEADKGVSLSVGYGDEYYDAKDIKGQVMGIDYKRDEKLGTYEFGIGASRDSKGEVFVGAYGEVKAYNYDAEAVYGSADLGATSSANISAGRFGGTFGYKDGTFGGSVGGALISGQVDVGANVAGVNVGVNAGLALGIEFGLKLGKETEVKFGPFTLGFSFGSAKTAQ